MYISRIYPKIYDTYMYISRYYTLKYFVGELLIVMSESARKQKYRENDLHTTPSQGQNEKTNQNNGKISGQTYLKNIQRFVLEIQYADLVLSILPPCMMGLRKIKWCI